MHVHTQFKRTANLTNSVRFPKIADPAAKSDAEGLSDSSSEYSIVFVTSLPP